MFPNLCLISFANFKALQIRFDKLATVSTVCSVFVDFSCSDISLFCKHSLLRFFPFNLSPCAYHSPVMNLNHVKGA